MSFPQLLNWGPGLIAAGIAVPLLLVLYFLKLRRREMAVSSTFLWKKAIQDLQVNAPFQKLRRNLLLFLQLALLLLLALALMRPVVSYAPPPGKSTVILIDRSASMSANDYDGKTRLDEAKRRAKELVDALGSKASAMVIAFDESAETVQPFTSDTSALKRQIDAIQPTDCKSRLKLAYQLAQAQTNFAGDQLRSNVDPPDVWVYSDGRVLDANELAIRGTVHFDAVGTDHAGNIAIVAMSARRNYERPTEVQVFARLANYGTTPVVSDVTLSVDNQIRTVAKVDLLPERWTDKQRADAETAGHLARDSVEFKIDVMTAAVIKVEQMNKTDDSLAADDVAQVVVPPPKNLEVLLVSDNNYFLDRVMQSLNLQNPTSLTPIAYEQKKDDKTYDVIIFDRYKPKKLPTVGSFIWFGVVPPETKLSAEKTEDGRLISLEDQTVLDWKRDHPIVDKLAMGKLYVGQSIKLVPGPETETLVEGTKGPLIVLHREARGTHLVVAFDLLQSNWPLKQSFPYFMYNALQFLAIGSDMDVREAFVPGSTPRIPRPNLQRLGASLKEVTLNGPDGVRSVPVPETGDFVLPPLNHTGLYTTQPPVPQYEHVAVNLLDDNESNLLPVQRAPGDIGEAVVSGKGKSRLELWWWIVAVAALPLLMAEWWIYTRRVHL